MAWLSGLQAVHWARVNAMHSMSSNFKHWSRYWARGRLTSLPQDFSANYDGEVAAFWRRQFDSLNPGAKLLDVCTGNGALALLAAAWSHEYSRAFSITGLDAARIDSEAVRQAHPEVVSRIGDIRFIDETPFEQSGLPTGSFDLVMSQYGIEYCDWQAAAASSEKLLRPGGQLVFVSHAPDSALVETMQRESSEFAVLDGLGVFRALEEFVSSGITTGRFRQELNRIGLEVFARDKAARSDLFRYVLSMADQLLSLNDAALEGQRSGIAAAADELSAARQRLADMITVNEAISRHPDWTAAFEKAGLTALDHGVLRLRGSHCVGMFHRFEKPSQT